jgi:hypothetical protein
VARGERNAMDAVALILGTVVALVSAGLLFIAAVVFAFYGVCLDYCDDAPDWTLGGALGNAVPWLLPALALLTGACCLFMVGARGRVSPFRAALVALLSTLVFAGAFALFVLAFAVGGTALALVLGLGLVAIWLVATTVAARRAAPSR